MAKNTGMAKFPRCQHFRELAGLGINDLVARLNNQPARSSIVRLEDGYPIRSHNAFKVAHSINDKLSEIGQKTFDVKKEVQRLTK